MNIACIAAFKMEIEWLLGELSHPRRRKSPGSRMWVGGLGAHKVALFLCGMGPLKARKSLEKFAAVYTADRIFHLGVCGSLVEGIPRYQPVAASRVSASYEVSGGPIELEEHVKDELAELGSRCQIRNGHLLTHNRPVFSSRVRDELHRKFSATCVDMEAWEVAAFCRQKDIPLTIIKAVSDFADAKSAVDFVFHARRAAQSAGQAVYSVIGK